MHSRLCCTTNRAVNSAILLLKEIRNLLLATVHECRNQETAKALTATGRNFSTDFCEH